MQYASNLPEPVFTIEDAGVYTVMCVATTKDGCTDTMYQWNALDVSVRPLAEFVPDPEVSMMGENGGLVHFINYSDSTVMTAQGASFRWDFGDGESDTLQVSPDHI